MIRPEAWLALVALSGCSALAGYPGGVPEASFEACHDRDDNDFDDAIDCDDGSCDAVCVERCDLFEGPEGRVDEDQDGVFDCDDTDCDGSCPEDEIDTCADGRDQDGDGLVDFEDAGCWYLADVRIDSCTSVPEVNRTLDFDGLDESWAHRGDVLRPDPTGRFPGDSLVVTSIADSHRVTLSGDVASAVVGLRIAASMYFDAARSSPSFGASVENVSQENGYTDLLTRLERRGASTQLWLVAFGTDGGQDSAFSTWEEPPGWYDFELAVPDSGHLTLRVTNAAGEEVASRTLSLTRGFEPSHRFELFVDPRLETGEIVVVGELRWHGDSYRPCDVETPSSSSPFRASVADAAILSDGLCVLSSNDAMSLYLARSTDRGLTVTAALGSDVVPMQAPLAATRAPDGSLAVLSQEVRGLFPSSVHVLSRSDDCTRLSEVARFELPGPRVVGMRARDDLYELVRTNTTRTQSAPVVLERITRDGAVLETIPLGALPAGDVSAVLHGNDVIFTNYLLPGRIGVVTSGPHTQFRITGAGELGPSGRAGACDEQSVLPALLTLDPSPVVEGATATGLVLVPGCNIQVEGLVAHRFSVFPPGAL